MQFILLPLLCLLSTSTALATPKITEIRLSDEPGFGPPSVPLNEFVFRADGNFYWLEGTTDKPIRHQYELEIGDFQKLATALETHHFFGLKSSYPDLIIPDAGATVVSAMRGRTKKSVTDNAGDGFRPRDLWELQMIIRGIAAQYIGLKRTSTKSPSSNLTFRSTVTPIPIIRGTQRVPN